MLSIEYNRRTYLGQIVDYEKASGDDAYSTFRQEKDQRPPTRPSNRHFESASGTRKTIYRGPFKSLW